MRVLAVGFAKESRATLSNCKMILESGLIAIDPRFDKLILSLRTAVANEMRLDKQQTSLSPWYSASTIHSFQIHRTLHSSQQEDLLDSILPL
jgi:hypothetical protein